MSFTRIWALGLRLYPFDYRLRFSAEMLASFEEAANRHRHQKSLRESIRFGVREVYGLVRGAAVEWMAKLTSDPAARARHMPDCRRMRPVGITREEWSAGLDAFCLRKKGQIG